MIKKIKTVGSVKDFLNPKEEQNVFDKVVAHYEDNRMIYHVTGATIVFTLTGSDFAFAATGIDAKANEIYGKVLNVGKWVIIIKGAVDVIRHVLKDGDIDGAKRSFFGHLIAFLLLLAYPWAMEQVEGLFA